MYKFNKQYRLPEFDYSSNNAYYITICTKNRQHFLGEISNNKMNYSEIGIYAENILKTISEKLDHINITNFVVMPNHIHFIGEIYVKDKKPVVPEKGLQPLVKDSISSFTNHFKGKVKRWCNENNFEKFEWQPRFRDRVIRDYIEYLGIADHIINNAKTWDDDPENIYRKE